MTGLDVSDLAGVVGAEEAQAGDRVLIQHAVYNPGGATQYRYQVLEVVRATRSRVVVGCGVYGRNGAPQRRGSQGSLVMTVTPELRAEAECQFRELAVTRAKREAERTERQERNARLAADAVAWLSAGPDPDTIRAVIGAADLTRIGEAIAALPR